LCAKIQSLASAQKENRVTKKELQQNFDKMQTTFGSADLNAAYGGGCENNPRLCLVFVNATARNIATAKTWAGPRYQWLGTKQVWNFLTKAGLFSPDLNAQVQTLKPCEWTEAFCQTVYQEVERQGIYITNLAKCTQADARALSNDVFWAYRELLLAELMLINPQKVVLFGNQVASIVLNQSISVSAHRKQSQPLQVGKKCLKCFPVYYPVGNGFFNAAKAVEDLTWVAALAFGK